MRSVGNVSLVFGLITLSMKLYSTVDSKDIEFKTINPETKNPVKQLLVDVVTGDPVDRAAALKGYEVKKGEYLLFTPEEIKSAEEDGNKAIEVAAFVPADQIEPRWVEKTYFVGVDKTGAVAYAALAEGMRRTQTAAVAQYATRGKQYLVAFVPDAEGLLMHQLVYPRLRRSWDDVPVARASAGGTVPLVEQLIRTSLRQEVPDLRDQVYERTVALIEARQAGKELPVRVVEESAPAMSFEAALKAMMKGA